MEPRNLLDILDIGERLKEATRHCYTSQGRHESVAEHSWRCALMAYFLKDEFPQADMNKVITMCIIHDLGESFTGDIPTFDKTQEDEKREDYLLKEWLKLLPQDYSLEMLALFDEMAKRETIEAKLFKAIDSLEALIQHNESDLKTWSENEYELNKVYADDKVAFSKYLTELREEVRKDTIEKLKNVTP